MATIFQAEFAGSATALSGYTPEIGTFTSISGNLEVNGSGELTQGADGGGSARISTTTAESDFDATFVVEIRGSYAWFEFRSAFDDLNYWGVGTDPAAGDVSLYKNVAGTETTVDIVTVGTYTPITVRVVCSGSTIDVYINTVLEMTDTSGDHSSNTGMLLGMFDIGAANAFQRIQIEDDGSGGGGPSGATIFYYRRLCGIEGS